jgi:regulatory protein
MANREKQLALSFPSAPVSLNNRAMSTSDGGDDDDAAKKLRNKALRLLTTREHSREELMRKLAQARARRARDETLAPKPDRDDIAHLVDDLAAQGWQSDDRYAEAIVRRLTGQASRRFIAEKLAQAGIKKDVAANALEALDQDEREVAQALWARRFGDTPKDDKDRQRQIRFLLSRGFHLGDAFKIVPKAPSVAPPPRTSGVVGEPGNTATSRPRSSFGRSRPWGRKNDRDSDSSDK